MVLEVLEATLAERSLVGSEATARWARAAVTVSGDTAGRVRRLFLTEMAEAYSEQQELMLRPSEVRRRDLVEALLTEREALSNSAELGYEMARWHLGMVGGGPRVREVLSDAARAVGGELLMVTREDGLVWAWIGGVRRLSTNAIVAVEDLARESEACIALGASARGFDGWRLTHHEASAAWLVGRRTGEKVTRCLDVLIDAAVLENERLAASLDYRFIRPLDSLRGGGAIARETLRAYYSCDRSVSSSASLLGVTRKTVERRLRRIEAVLGTPVRGCVELEVALRLERWLERGV